jgi:hypothetical protein
MTQVGKIGEDVDTTRIEFTTGRTLILDLKLQILLFLDQN